MRNRPPTFRRTYEYIKRTAEHVTFGKIAAISGKSTDVAEAWGRPFESDDNPAGTGKKDPSQTILRLIGLAHSKDPGLAREWASTFPEYVDYLDAKAGRESERSVCELAAIYLKEHAEMVAEILHRNDGNWEGLWTELAQCEGAFFQLKACIKEQMAVEVGDDHAHEIRSKVSSFGGKAA